MNSYKGTIACLTILSLLFTTGGYADYFTYDGRLSVDVHRDRIMAIAEDHAFLEYYAGPDNVVAQCAGTTVFDTEPGWKVGCKYVWGGENTTAQYLEGIALGLSAGNRNTSSDSTAYGACAVGTDCSGFVSVCWTSGRYATSTFHNVSNVIPWDNLRMGDALNIAGSHIRLFDYFTDDTHTSMLYESTSGGGLYWKTIHRTLSRDNNYDPIRYNKSTYQVKDYPEPVILKIWQVGVERALVRWDGQADIGFNLYISDDGSSWQKIRQAGTDLGPIDRTTEVSGLFPGAVWYFKMTSENTGGETIDSNVACFRLNDDQTNQVLLVEGSDRYRDQFETTSTLAGRTGAILGAHGVGFDYAANETIVNQYTDLLDYESVFWILLDESTYHETFSWPEQKALMSYLDQGGRLFVSGAEIGWDLDYRANWDNYKNGHVNDNIFYNTYLQADYVADDADTYQAQGVPGSIFEGIALTFDDGSGGAYDVEFPDVISPLGASAGLNYQGGVGGTAAVYTDSASGSVVYLGFPFETITTWSARYDVMEGVLKFFDLPVEAPTLVSVCQTGADAATVTWQGHGPEGFRLYRKSGNGSWSMVMDETSLPAGSTVAEVTGLSEGVRYAFKVQAVNSTTAGPDSVVGVFSGGAIGEKILLVDGYDRYSSQEGSNHTLLENYATALSAGSRHYDSCANEAVAKGEISLQDYGLVIWMCGEESTESETFGLAEQLAVQNYLRNGGKLFVSGSEIGWDLVQKADDANDYLNGSANDTPFYEQFLRAQYEADDAGTYAVEGAVGTVFEGLSFSFDDGSQGMYDANYPDVISPAGNSEVVLNYDGGANGAGMAYSGMFPGGISEGKVVYLGFPFETVYPESERVNLMSAVLLYMQGSQIGSWVVY
jgi:hypothetical protein